MLYKFLGILLLILVYLGYVILNYDFVFNIESSEFVTEILALGDKADHAVSRIAHLQQLINSTNQRLDIHRKEFKYEIELFKEFIANLKLEIIQEVQALLKQQAKKRGISLTVKGTKGTNKGKKALQSQSASKKSIKIEIRGSLNPKTKQKDTTNKNATALPLDTNQKVKSKLKQEQGVNTLLASAKSKNNDKKVKQKTKSKAKKNTQQQQIIETKTKSKAQTKKVNKKIQ